eukprot:TRINITY_DN8526_c0_g1_i1.p1 TRINITY_DN8526_c0_g1~~TRINITY_DN8526_c0_g1_i1.p1  ORF type:complete len:364 (-),score=60.59 TRINITY_DN8526_c0_g1_i1:157-1248(-)
MGRKTWGIIAGSLGAIYAADYLFNASSLERTLRTGYNGVVIAVDYKLNFKPGADFEKLHARTAQRMLNVCLKNGGLYIKFGQQIASMNHVLPVQYQRTFKVLYDDAPVVDYSEIEKIFLQDFGLRPDQIFSEFDEKPVASASIAQVHKARLKDGTQVAVKVQKPNIRKQMNFDLFAYKTQVWLSEKLFGLPLMWSVDYICDHLRQEVDFENEARNAERAWSDIQKSPELRKDIYVPKVYRDHLSKRVMINEWIDGIRFSDIERVKSSGYNVSSVMERIVSVFAYQIFTTGFLHCDPHPGNIIVRTKPHKRSIFDYIRKPKPEAQIVLLDHGLYVQESSSFRKQYCVLWKSLFTICSCTPQSQH